VNPTERNPGDPIDNLGIGTIVEVDGTHVVADLDPGIAELSRVFAGDIYAIGQFGSIIRIHFGRRIIYGYVCRLRMKAEYERERGLPSGDSATARIIEADLFGEGEWICTDGADSAKWQLQF